MAGQEFVIDFPTLGDLAEAWIRRHCRVPDGFARGRPFELADWQFWCTANRYRVKPDAAFVLPEEVGPDNPPVLGQAFHYRQTLVVGPQKCGKGPGSASHIAFEASGPSVFSGWASGGERYRCADNGCRCGWSYEFMPGEPMGMRHPSPIIQITAFSEDQAAVTFRWLRAMIRLGPLKETLAVREGFIRILGQSGDDDLDRIDIVTSSANSRLGNPVSDVEQDEVGLWTKSNKMLDVADNQARGAAGMGGRTHSTTNAWNPADNSYAQQVYEAADPDVFVYYRNPDEKLLDEHGLPLSFRHADQRRRILEYVYAGSWWVNLDGVEAKAVSLLKRDPAQAERFYGNRIVPGSGAFLSPELVTRRTVVKEPDRRISLGFDGSSSGDWTAIRAEDVDGYRFTPTYPVGDDERPTIWNPARWGGRIPRTEVRSAVAHIFATFDVERFYCDPRDWQTEIDEWALAHGEKVVVQWPTNQIGRMHAALDRYQVDLTEGGTTHADDPAWRTHALNAVKVAKPGDRFILAKPAEHQKIDALMADVLAHEAAADARATGWTEPASNTVLVFR